ncbi:arginine--tRNA ligase [Candidatus Woesearchaeota archaeon]|nr:arginine--tRNA ligase [Candidatus Woesearchaeota archaeon]
MDFVQQIAKLLAKEVKFSLKDVSSLLAVPPDAKLGDYAFPCFRLGKNPKEAADKLKKKLKLPKWLSRIEVAGPYLNFFVNPAVLAEETLTEINKEKGKYGSQDKGKGKKIVIDFSSPNIAKPFGIGHLRSTVIGNSLYKIHNFLGYKAVGINHLGDWGTQFGKLIVAYQKWGDVSGLKKDPINYLLKLYVKFHRLAEKDPSLDDEARRWFKKLEDGNKEATSLWKKFRELSLKEFEKVYSLLDVEFDSYRGESFYNNLLDKTIQDVGRKTKTEMSEGALIVDLEKYGMPPVLLRKSDGATTYHTRDLAAAFYRLKKYSPEKLIYVVGSPQKLNFDQLFKTLGLCGVDEKKLVHVSFGLFRFPEGKMSTRKGNVVLLEDVLSKAIGLVEKIIKEKNPKLKNKKEVAKQIGIGAIIFADLSNNRRRDIEFDWDRMLSFDGETGPYLQYTHARACSILRRVKGKVSSKVNFETFNLAEEMKVVKLLGDFPEVLGKVLENYMPHHLANYLISLAQAFNEFYHKCPVISDQKHTMKARLLLVDSVRQVLENGLGLLGIKAPKEM